MRFWSILVAAAAYKFTDNGIAGNVGRVQRRNSAHHLHQIRQAVLFQIFRRQLLAELGNFVKVLGQNAGLVIVEGVNVDGGVFLIGLDIVEWPRVL